MGSERERKPFCCGAESSVVTPNKATPRVQKHHGRLNSMTFTTQSFIFFLKEVFKPSCPDSQLFPSRQKSVCLFGRFFIHFRFFHYCAIGSYLNAAGRMCFDYFRLWFGRRTSRSIAWLVAHVYSCTRKRLVSFVTRPVIHVCSGISIANVVGQDATKSKLYGHCI